MTYKRFETFNKKMQTYGTTFDGALKVKGIKFKRKFVSA